MLKATACFTFVFSALFISLNGHAEIYRWVDSQGNVEYSDEPRDGAEEIKVAPIATISIPKITSRPPASEGEEETGEVTRYQKLAITFPQPDSAFHSGDGNISVTVNVEPALASGHQLRYSLDGQVLQTGKAAFTNVSNLNRGTHSLQVDIVDGENVVQSAAPVTFTLHRPSVARKK